MTPETTRLQVAAKRRNDLARGLQPLVIGNRSSGEWRLSPAVPLRSPPTTSSGAFPVEQPEHLVQFPAILRIWPRRLEQVR
jgi:hypothetical protein